MKIIKNINTNYAIAVDDDNNHVVVCGKGIGFGSVPREIEDITVIERSYYDVDSQYFSMIKDIDETVISISTKIVDYAREKLDMPFNSNLVFILADHINFSIEKQKKNMSFKMPIMNDIEWLYPDEYKIGKLSVNYINKKLNTYLPKDEASFIALHIIEAEEKKQEDDIFYFDEKVIDDIVKIIEKQMELCIDINSINYSRFITHMRYLLKRGRSMHLIESDNLSLYETTKKEYPSICKCVDYINDYLISNVDVNLAEEEQLYLILHVNRLCSRK